MSRIEQLTVVGLALSSVGMALWSQDHIGTISGMGGLALQAGGVIVLLYAVMKSNSSPHDRV
jgi:hypothetical protein